MGGVVVMPDASVLWPAGLTALVLAPLAWLALRDRARRRAARREAWLGPRAPSLAPARRLPRARAALLAACLAGLALAAAQPSWGEENLAAGEPGADLVVVLDVSRSMLARDHAPTRLAAAQAAIRALVEGGTGADRFALVLFAGEAQIAVPLTHDRDTFLGLTELASPDSLRRGGSDLGAALELALDAAPEEAEALPVALLLTDGEDLEQRGLTAAERWRARGGVVHALGFGSPRGSKIALGDGAGSSFLQDSDGRDVVSVLDEAGLEAIAASTGGAYRRAGDDDALLALHRDHVVPERRARSTERGERTPANRFQWPLLAAYLLGILELCCSDRRRS